MCNLANGIEFQPSFSTAAFALNSGSMRELSILEVESVAGGDINWGAVYRSASAGAIGGAVAGAITGAIIGSMAGGVGAVPGAIATGVGGAWGGAVTGGLVSVFDQLSEQ